MREIKFRAWHEKGKGYFGWGILNDFFAGLKVAIHEKIDTISTKRGDPSKSIKTWQYSSKYTDIFTETDFILEQYTGLKDKNGKEIFEGDICRHTWDFVTPYKTHRKGFDIETVTFDTETAKWLYGDDGLWGNNINNKIYSFEIIGNIHENSELLK